MCLRTLRIDPNSLPIGIDCLFKLPIALQGNSQIVVNLARIRLKRNRLPIANDRLFKLPDLCQRIPKIAPINRIRRTNPRRSSDQFRTRLRLARLHGQYPQRMQCLRMIGLSRQDLPVNCLSLRQAARLVMQPGGFELLLEDHLADIVIAAAQDAFKRAVLLNFTDCQRRKILKQ